VDGGDADGQNGEEEPAYTSFSPAQDRLIIDRVATLLDGLGDDKYLSTTSLSDIAAIVYVARNLQTVVRHSSLRSGTPKARLHHVAFHALMASCNPPTPHPLPGRTSSARVGMM
jgi:hypothetical protein